MKKIILFLMIGIILSACGLQEKDIHGPVITDSINKQPPQLVVSADNSEVVAVLGTHSWSYNNGDGTSTGIEADSGAPPEMVQYQTDPINIKLGSEINLNFAKSPDEVRVYIWNDNYEEREVKVGGTNFKTDE